MQRSAVLFALLACAWFATPGVAQDFMSEQEFIQSQAVDNLIWPNEAQVAPFPYQSPLQRTYFATDFVSLQRRDSSTIRLATLGTTTTTMLTSRDVDVLNEPGLRVTFGRRFNNDFALETTYFGLFQWDNTASVHNATTNSLGTSGNLFSPFTSFGNPATVGFDYNNFVSGRTETKLDNFELNLRQRLDMPYSNVQVTALYGFRYLSIRDLFEYRSRSNSPVLGGTANLADVLAKNNMYGVQLGGSIQFHIERRAWLDFEAKGIMLQNDMQQQTAFTTGPLAGPGTTTSGSNSKGRISFAGDIQGSCVWQFTSRIVGRVGYQAVFIDGVALGAENFNANSLVVASSPTGIAYKGQLTFHGPFVGLVFTW
jgi:hypothetical protein